MNESDAPSSRETSLRITRFAGFFKNYMSVSTIVAASIPIPIASWKLIPIYSQQRSFLTVYASLFCFLLLAFAFSIRHRLSIWMFSRSGVSGSVAVFPMICIVLTLGCILAYHYNLQQSFAEIRAHGLSLVTTNKLLEQTDYSEIPRASTLAATYLGIFIFAEAAFVLMAIREYLQDVLHLDEIKLLRGEPSFPATVIAPSPPILDSSQGAPSPAIDTSVTP